MIGWKNDFDVVFHLTFICIHIPNRHTYTYSKHMHILPLLEHPAFSLKTFFYFQFHASMLYACGVVLRCEIKCKKCCVTKSKCRSDLTDTHTEKNSLRNSLSFFISFLPILYWQNLLLLYIVAHFTYRTLCLHTNKSTCKERKMQKWIHTHKRWEIPQQNQIWTFFVTSISILRKKHEIHIVADVKGKETGNERKKSWIEMENGISLSRDGTIANRKNTRK